MSIIVAAGSNSLNSNSDVPAGGYGYIAFRKSNPLPPHGDFSQWVTVNIQT